jgi:serine protease Do
MNLRSLSLLSIILSACFLCPFAGAADEALPRVPTRGCPDLVDLIKNLKPAVVTISIEKNTVAPTSTEPRVLFRSRPGLIESRKDHLQSDSLGSGFFCDTSGHIITNAHVVEGASKILVTLSSGKVEAASVVAIHPKVDLALIKINPPHTVQKAQIGDSSIIEEGEWVLAMGNPFGIGKSHTVGIVSGKGRFLGLGPDDDFIQTDAAINPGNSGGPLFNMAGEVIGVNTAIIASGKGIGFSIPSNYLADLFNAPAGSGSGVVRGWLGIYVDDITADAAKKLGMSVPQGALVDEVLGAAPAFNAGLKKGDLILGVDGKAIKNGKHLSTIVADTKPGDVLKMKVLRGKTAHLMDVIIGAPPE